LTAAGTVWSKAARHLAADPPTQAGSSLQRVLADLQDEAGTSADCVEPTLTFLSPPARPSSLGLLDHYDVSEVLGQGGMGILLKAFDQTLHRVVAIKVMAPHLAQSATARKRFFREARAAAAVRHDHIIDIHAVAEANGLPYLVMEYVAGPSLQERI